jgi:hypothetical protein
VSDNVGFKKFIDNNGTFISRVLADGFAWDFAGFSNNLDTNILIEVSTLYVLKSSLSVEKSNTTSWNNTFFSSSSSSAESVLDSIFKFSNFNF